MQSTHPCPLLSALSLSVALAACGSEDRMADVADTNDVTEPTTWHVALSGLDNALLAVWGGAHDDLWFVGADKRDGLGPLVVQAGQGRTFNRVDVRGVDPAGGHLWWVHGGGSAVWMVGEGGRAFRYDRVRDELERIDTGTTATLYGVWGASDSELWAVGGRVLPDVGPPVIVRLTPEGGAPVADLPQEVLGQGTFFKVWGAGPDDIWVVGEQGRVLHYDGEDWKVVPLDAKPRLVTIHGAGQDVVAVGGATQAVILEHDGAAFRDRSPEGVTLLSGVHVGPSGEALAVGMVGLVMRREAAGEPWRSMAGLPVVKDWHAVWRDQRGDWWLVGGNLLSASRFDEGVILRLGPARSDVATGSLIDLDPVTPDPGPEPDDVAEAVEVVEVVEVEVDVEVVESDVEDVGDVAEDTNADTAETQTLGELELGSYDAASGTFVPFVSGQSVPLMHGPQGGFHVEGFLRFTDPATVDPLEAQVELSVWVDGAIRARFKSGAYPVPRAEAGVYMTYMIFAIFCEDPPPGDCFIPLWDSAAFDGKAATLRATVTPTGSPTMTREWAVTLEDTL
jgi:hypothetical protein